MFERMKSHSTSRGQTRRGFIGSAGVLALTGTAGFAAGLVRDEIVDRGKEAVFDLMAEPSSPPPAPGYAISPRSIEAFKLQAADYQHAAHEAWQSGRSMADLPDICRPRSTQTFKGANGLRFVRSIGGGLRLWGSEIDGLPLVQAFDAEYGRFCAGRLNKCNLEQKPVAEMVAAVFRLRDGTTVDATYLSLQLPYPNGDVISISKPIKVRTV